jgi:hypothetical protein
MIFVWITALEQKGCTIFDLQYTKSDILNLISEICSLNLLPKRLFIKND